MIHQFMNLDCNEKIFPSKTSFDFLSKAKTLNLIWSFFNKIYESINTHRKCTYWYSVNVLESEKVKE